MAAHAQGKFWEMVDKIFANQSKLKQEDLLKYAEELGLDMDKFRSDMDSKAYADAIEEDLKFVKKYGLRGTPSIFVNGRFLSGAKPYRTFKALVEQELKWIKEGNRPEFKVGKNVREVMPKRKRRGPDPNKVYKIDVAGAPIIGPKQAKVTIVEYADYQ